MIYSSLCETQPAVCVAIVAVTIAFSSLIVAIISCVIAAKSYKKSKRLEFFQRRDKLFVTISDLNVKYSDAHLISARYEIVAVTKASLRLRGEQADENTAQIVSIKEIQKNIEKQATNRDQNIAKLHAICSALTSKTHADLVESLIAMVTIASDDVKKYNESMLSSLHIFETTNSIIRASLTEGDERIRRIDLDLEKAISDFKLQCLE